MDRMAGFLRDCCVLGPYTAKAADLYQAYLGWCARNGETAVQQRTFGSMLGERGCESTKLHGLAAWKGLRPKTPEEVGDEKGGLSEGLGGGWGGTAG
jgi:phage/plasmid-associated DNA primase